MENRTAEVPTSQLAWLLTGQYANLFKRHSVFITLAFILELSAKNTSFVQLYSSTAGYTKDEGKTQLIIYDSILCFCAPIKVILTG